MQKKWGKNTMQDTRLKEMELIWQLLGNLLDVLQAKCGQEKAMREVLRFATKTSTELLDCRELG